MPGSLGVAFRDDDEVHPVLPIFPFGKRGTLAIYDERDSRNSSWLFLQSEIDNLLEACFTPNYLNETIHDGMTSLLSCSNYLRAVVVLNLRLA